MVDLPELPAIIVEDPNEGETEPRVERESRRDRLRRLQANPGIMDIICANAARGIDLFNLCKTWDVEYGYFVNWLSEVEERKQRYERALHTYTLFVIEEIKNEIRLLATSDIRDLYTADGVLKDPKDWPPHLARCVSSIETIEKFTTKGEKIGEVKKVKLWDKAKALDAAGRTLALFTVKHEHSGKVSIEDLVNDSTKVPSGNG